MSQPFVRMLCLAAVFLSTGGICAASIQGKQKVYWLGAGSWQLCEKAGEACLIDSQWGKDVRRLYDVGTRLPAEKIPLWRVSAPTIQSPSGKYLASDPEGRQPTVHLVTGKGANTEWLFEFVSTLSPEPAKNVGHQSLKRGPSGFAFRVKMAEGPFKGWYLGSDETAVYPTEPSAKRAASRCLKLVRDVKEAIVLTYIEEFYYVYGR